MDRGVLMAKNLTVTAVAVCIDGVVHSMPPPHRHHHLIHALNPSSNSWVTVARGEQGFLLSDGSFVGRVEAGKRAVESGQVETLEHPPELYSEDLW